MISQWLINNIDTKGNKINENSILAIDHKISQSTAGYQHTYIYEKFHFMLIIEFSSLSQRGAMQGEPRTCTSLYTFPLTSVLYSNQAI